MFPTQGNELTLVHLTPWMDYADNKKI